MKKSFLFLALVFLLSSCVHAISEQYREAARKGVSFSRILENPDTYMNSIFVFGGTIVETTNTEKGSEIEVIQNPIDRYGRITDKDVSEGRLILLSSQRLDPVIYKGGRTLTFAGKLIGAMEKPLAGLEYHYPVFKAEELHLWRPETYYYNPYPLGYDPFFSPSPYWYGPVHRPYFY
jgi:outer membrane lipoprotein